MKKFSELKKPALSPGRVVRSFRLSWEMTLKELEQITGIPQTNLSAIENEKMDVGVRRAVLLAAAFGIGPENILFPEGYERPEDKEAKKVRERAEKYYSRQRRAARRTK